MESIGTKQSLEPITSHHCILMFYVSNPNTDHSHCQASHLRYFTPQEYQQ